MFIFLISVKGGKNPGKRWLVRTSQNIMYPQPQYVRLSATMKLTNFKSIDV